MKLIGLLGGMSWESSAVYYRTINEAVRRELGTHHSARILMHSVDFAPIMQSQHAGEWDRCTDILVDAARSLADGGASLLVIATNTMHKVAEEIEAGSRLPVLHIADPTGQAVRADGFRKVALLATRFTMEERFYRDRLETRFGLNVVIPGAAERDEVHRVIYDELCLGIVTAASAARFGEIISRMAEDGCEAVILGCTEIGMLVSQDNSPLPIFDTTALHAEAAVRMALDTSTAAETRQG